MSSLPRLPVLAALVTLVACGSDRMAAPRTADAPMRASLAPTIGLLAYYPLDGDASDLSGNAWNGTVLGGVIAAPDRFDFAGHALAFDGIDGRVILPAPATDGLTAGTINLWLQVSGESTAERCGRPEFPLMEPDGCQYNVFHKPRAPDAIGLRAQFGSTTGPGASINTFYFTVDGQSLSYVPSGPYAFTEWHMFTFVWGPAGTRVYLDATLLAAVPGGLSAPTGEPMFLGHNGHSAFGGRERLEGVMDEFRVYGRELTDAEITILFAVLPDPTSEEACRDGSWEAYGFRNQGQCVRFIETGEDSR